MCAYPKLAADRKWPGECLYNTMKSLSYISTFVVFFSAFTVADLNLCSGITSICVPQEDISINCTCFLFTSFDGYNSTLPIANISKQGRRNHSLYLLWPQSWNAFSDFQLFFLPQSAKVTLDLFFPYKHEEVLRQPFPEVFKKLDFVERLGLYVFNETNLPEVMTKVSENVLLIEYSRRNILSWCETGNCEIYTGQQMNYNETTHVHRYAMEVLRGFLLEDGGYFLVGYSVIDATFNLKKLRSQICVVRCDTRKSESKHQCIRTCQNQWAFIQRL